MLTQARLKEFLKYDPETGGFYRVKQAGRSGPPGSVVRTVHSKGYMTLGIDGGEYLQHRLVWLYVHGRFPPADIDHINGNRSDNRLANLRAATRAENLQNKAMQSNNTSGQVGVTWRANRGHWVAQIKTGGAHRYLGSFKTVDLAREAYLKAKAELHLFQPIPREMIT